jgi:type I restriction enzyme S subunit
VDSLRLIHPTFSEDIHQGRQMRQAKIEEQYFTIDKFETDYVLPEGWATGTLEDLIGHGGILIDGDWIESKDQDPNGDIRLIQLADIGDGIYKNKSSRFLTLEKAKDLDCTFLKPGDVLIARMPEPLGRTCIFPGDPKPAVTAVDICIIRTGDDGADHRWIMHTVNSPEIRRRIESLQKGTTRKRISRRNLASLTLPIPPVNEQRRIAVKVEELLARVNATKERLARVSMFLRRFRQAVLAAACSGRLTADWRDIHVHKETAEMFVARILEQRKAQWKVEEAAESGSNDSQTRRSRRSRYKEPLEPTYHLELELPDTWCFATVDQLTSLVTKGSSPGWQGFEYIESGVPFVRSQNVRWGTLDLSDLAYLPFEFNETHANSIIHIGDVLLNLVGASVGRAAIAAKEIENANCNQAVGIIRLVQDGVINRYLMLYFLSPQTQHHIHATKADFARANFNLDDIKPMIVPIPPLIEQQEIVRHVESMFKLADAIEKRVATATVRAEKLTQAILAKVFRGELVPTETELARREGRSYEIASDLLARIKSERESKPVSKVIPRNRNQKKQGE